MAFPKLYKKSSKGDVQTWQVFVKENSLWTQHGKEGGAIVKSTPDFVKGKNIGRANQTTPEEQAALEATAKHTKKLATGYVLSKDQLDSVDSSVGGGIFPMLAKNYNKSAHKIVFPAFAQPKLDGHRCVAQVDDEGVCTLWTRKRKPITSMPHIIKAIEAQKMDAIMLDGELYCGDYTFERMAHFIRKSTPQPGGEKMEFHIFDFDGVDDFADRTEWIDSWIGDDTSGCLKVVETVPIKAEPALLAYFRSCIQAGWEGCMVRNAEGAYEASPTHRSDNLQKIKQMDDAEFKVVGVKEGRGQMQGKAVFTCETAEGAQFDVKLKGAIDDLAKYLDDPSLAIGRQLTVQYQGMTGKARVPRFPVGLRFRDD